jgi:hypothetical protein
MPDAMSPRWLYHFSEDGEIPVFEPHVMNAASRAQTGIDEPLVWAIDEESSPLYFFPRDCPRILYWPTASTTQSDRDLWWGRTAARMVACIEWDWLDRVRGAHVFRYRVAGDTFSFHGVPGMYVSRAVVAVESVEPVGDLLHALRDANVELRLMRRLTPLRGIWDTSLHASGVRLRHAQDWNEP